MGTINRKIVCAALIMTCLLIAGNALAADIVVDQNTTWSSGAYDYNNVLVTNGAILTLEGNVMLNAQQITISPGAAVSADGTGYPAGQGPGAGGIFSGHGTGGGYGGKGGSRNDTGGGIYGPALNPGELGSGGGNGNAGADSGGAGGGAIRIDVNDLVVNGTISANGMDGKLGLYGLYGGGGSGGSIYITASQFSGAGLICANGGYGRYGAGGGGRVAVHYANTDFAGTVQAARGEGITEDDFGQDGTVALIDTTDNVLYTGHSFRLEQPDSPMSFNAITIDGSTVSTNGDVTVNADDLSLDNGAQLILSGDNTVTTVQDLNMSAGSAITLNGNCNLTITNTVNIANSTLTTAGPQNLILPSQDITLASGTTLAWGPGTYNYDNINITEESTLLCNGNVTLNAGNVTVDPCCYISANATGYPGEQGPGVGGFWFGHGTGGGYGGEGGSRNDSGGTTYGSSLFPVNMGSGGGNSNVSFNISGAGGGATRLNTDSLVVNGVITANGGDGTFYSPYGLYGGGGSGGSIYITTEQLAGSGLISANGGYGRYGGGGGGRVAVYYATSSFQGTVEADAGKGITEQDYGENGSVIFNDPSLDSPVTAMRAPATYISESTLSETIRAMIADANNIVVTGDFNSVLSFSNFKIVTIESGSFADRGFTEAQWQVNLNGVDYSGLWHAMTTRERTDTDNIIYIKGAISGEITGITKGYFVESANEPNLINTYNSTWTLNRIGDQIVNSTIELSGLMNCLQPVEYPSTALYALQGAFDATSYGHYTGPLGTVLTHVRVADSANPYNGEGFSTLSYVSNVGQGQAWAYNSLEATDVAGFEGYCGSPLLGIFRGVLEETEGVTRLSVTIERIDVGMEPKPILDIETWGPRLISPGEAVDYTIEYRNDGVVPAEMVTILYKIPTDIEFLSCTEGGVYKEHGTFIGTPEVRWYMETIPAKSKGILNVKGKVVWGLPEDQLMMGVVMVDQLNNIPRDPGIVITSTVIEANDTFVEMEFEIADQNGSMGTYTTTCTLEESTGDIEPNLIITEADGNTTASLIFTVNPVVGIYIMGTGGNFVGFEKAVTKYIMHEKKDMLDFIGVGASESQFINWMYSRDYLDYEAFNELSGNLGDRIFMKYNASEIVGKFPTAQEYYEYISREVLSKVAGIPTDKLAAEILSNEVIRWQNTGEMPRFPLDADFEEILRIIFEKYLFQEEPAVHEDIDGDGRPDWWSEEFISEIENQSWSPWYEPEESQGFFDRIIGSIKSWIMAAFDPNKKYGPDGRVLPAQKLDYRVEFENLGKGIAFGVYFTDTLDEDVNDATLQIGPVIDVNDGSTLAGSGTYNPDTRTITWFVGQVDPNQGGYAQYCVDVDSNAPHGTEIINYATIYFPSVPQELRTNAIVSTVLLNLPPTADAGSDQAVHVGDTVVLDGSDSTDPDGDILTFNWRFGLKPTGSQAVLDDPNTLNPVFVPDVPGTYTIALRVSDGNEQSGFDAVKISTVNVAPIADAGEDQAVYLDDMVTLDASGSTDPDGDLITYEWAFESIPTGSNTVLNDPNTLNPTFIADVPGIYVANLVVTDGNLDSEPDTVSVSTVNLAPIADAGEDQSVYVDDLVTLDASASSDPDGHPLTYNWAFTVLPQASNAVLNDSNTVNPTFTADMPGTYVVSLVVNDGIEDSNPDTVSISTINVAPIADAGEDQAAYIGDLVLLDGNASWDPDGDSLTYSWSMAAIPQDSAAVLSNTDTAEPNFVVDLPGTYVISLTVNDGTLDSQPDTVSISTINVAPIADAGQNQSVFVNDLVTLDGSQSYDPDDDSISYYWAFASVPYGSAAVLDDSSLVNPTFTADVPGIYVVSLVVNDGTIDSTPASVTVSAVTQQSQTIAVAQQIIDAINALNTNVFRNKNNQKTLTNKLNAVIEKLENAQYDEAMKKLENDISRKMNGCAESGSPDKNDWIKDCDAQNAVYPMVLDLIDLLDQLI